MKSSIKGALAAFVIIFCVTTSAFAAKKVMTDDTPPPITPGPYHSVIPCNAERGTMKTACKKNPCTATCKEATKAMKACRIEHHLPAPPVGSQKVTCSPGDVNSHPITPDNGTTIEDQGYMNGNRNGVINNNTVQPGQ